MLQTQPLAAKSAVLKAAPTSANLSRIEIIASQLPSSVAVGTYQVSQVKNSSSQSKQLNTDKGSKELPKELVPENFEQGQLEVVATKEGYKLIYTKTVLPKKSGTGNQGSQGQLLENSELKILKDYFSSGAGLTQLSAETLNQLNEILGNNGEALKLLKQFFGQELGAVNKDQFSEVLKQKIEKIITSQEQLTNLISSLFKDSQEAGEVPSEAFSTLAKLLLTLKSGANTEISEIRKELVTLFNRHSEMLDGRKDNVLNALGVINNHEGKAQLLEDLGNIVKDKSAANALTEKQQIFISKLSQALSDALKNESGVSVTSKLYFESDLVLLGALKELKTEFGAGNPSASPLRNSDEVSGKIFQKISELLKLYGTNPSASGEVDFHQTESFELIDRLITNFNQKNFGGKLPEGFDLEKSAENLPILKSEILLKGLLELTKSNSELSLPDKIKSLLNQIGAQPHEIEVENKSSDPNLLSEFSKLASKELVDSKSNAQRLKTLDQFKKLDSILRSNEIMDQLNPILKSLGEPVFLMFPNLMGNFLTSLEVCFAPHDRVTRDQKEKSDTESSDEDPFIQVQIATEMPKFGKIGIDLKFNSKQLFMELIFENLKVVEFVTPKIWKLSEKLQEYGKRKIFVSVKQRRIHKITPDWLHEVVAEDTQV